MPLTLPNTSPPHVCVVPCSIYLTYCFGSGGRHGGSRAGGGWQLAFASLACSSGVRVGVVRGSQLSGSGVRAVVRLSFVLRCAGFIICLAGCSGSSGRRWAALLLPEFAKTFWIRIYILTSLEKSCAKVIRFRIYHLK